MEQFQKQNQFRKKASLFILVVVMATAAVVYSQKQQIFDYVALRNYMPPSRVIALADDTTMRDATRKVFYVNHPELNDKTAFRNNCPTGERSIVLGCYVERKGIYVLDVTDSRLNGVMQVTTAHETLHAQYDRLSDSERVRVDEMTATFFATLDNDRIKKNIEQYRVKDPSVVPNELHSILASEVRTLSPELEQYYSQYFTNRSKIVEFSEQYEQTFVTLNTQVDSYDSQLKAQKETIESNQLRIDELGTDIEKRKAQLDTLINSGQTSSYNDSVAGFNNQVRRYNSLITETKALISDYNATVEKRNSIVGTEQELVEAINSNITTKQTE